MSELVTASPVVTTSHDRSAGLILFGIMQLLLGVGCSLFVLGITASTELAARRGAAAPLVGVAGGLMLYVLAALYFFSAGIGSIRRRRWARPVTLAVSWIWIAAGVVAMVTALVIIPQIALARAGVFGLLALFYLVIPAALIAFYRGDDVRATLEAYDPIPRWSDRAPVPVLALSIATAAAALVLVATASSSTAIPLFGTLLTGASATLGGIALAGLLGFVAIQLYRLRKSAWWVMLFVQLAAVIGAVAASIRGREPGEPGLSPLVWIIAVAAWGGFFGFLFYVRRYFEGAGPRTRSADVRARAGF